jgi:hypothetical protein
MKNENHNSVTPTGVEPPSQSTDWKQIERTDPVAFRTKMEQFIELRAQGLSLGKISNQIGVPKSTLYGWNIRNREMLACLRRVEIEAIEERLIGSQQQQVMALIETLNRLDKAFKRKLRECEDDLSATEIYWMASNLRSQIQRMRTEAAITDAGSYV